MKGNSIMQLAERIQKMPPYMFSELDKTKDEILARGEELLDLGVGDPVEIPPVHVLRALQSALNEATSKTASETTFTTTLHRYPPYTGIPAFKEAVARFYERRFGVSLETVSEVLALLGSKEGIAHIFQVILSPGDYCILTDPCFPMYKLAATLAGGEVYPLPIKEDNGYLPDLESIPMKILRKTKMVFLNYPNNPTSAVAPLGFFSEAVAFAREYNLLICNDNAYSEMAFDGYRPPSILEVPGAKDVAVEFNSLSKPYNMAGWRIGYAVGNKEIISALGRVKEVYDSGVWKAIQLAGIEALDNGDQDILNMVKIYQKRRDVVIKKLKEAGTKVDPPQATLYVWVPVPGRSSSEDFVKSLLKETKVVVTPGVGFGENGEGYFRISLTVKDEILEEAMTRLIKFIKSRVPVAS